MDRPVYNALCSGDERETIECSVKGSIPSWLNGHILRIGPGEFDIGTETFKHWFDGHALLHRFEISDGKVSYTSKFLRSETFVENHKHNRIILGGFGTASYPDPCKSLFSRFFTLFGSHPPYDNCNINIATLGNVYYALTDAGLAYRIDQSTLETGSLYKFDELFGIGVSTAHPHYDKNGDYYNLGSSFGITGYYGIFRIPASSMTKPDPLEDFQLHAKIPIENDKLKPSYFHSFGLSENFIILHDQSVRLNALKMLKISFTWEGVIHGMEHDEKRESIFHVVDKKKKEKLPIKFASKGRFCFHHINAFEESREGKKFLVVDMLCSDGASFLTLWVNVLRNDPGSRKDLPKMWPYRFILPLDVSTDTPKGINLIDLDDCKAEAVLRDDGSVFLTPELLIKEGFSEEFSCLGLELPTINYEEHNQRKYKYVYCVGEEAAIADQLVKLNVQSKTASQWKERGCFPSEPIFVKNPNSFEEDDGVILSTVINENPEEKVFLLILDAKTFKEMARAEVNVRLPYSFHGRFTPRETEQNAK